jgi:hypothetical protein
MKFAPANSAATRQDRSARLRRDRAAALAMRTVFPAVEQLRLELRFESGTSITPVAQSHILHPPARAYFTFPCPYADCDGQFELAAAVQSAVEDPARRSEGALECAGARVGNRLARRPCQLRLIYAITATSRQAL